MRASGGVGAYVGDAPHRRCPAEEAPAREARLYPPPLPAQLEEKNLVVLRLRFKILVILGSGFKVQASGFRVQGAGFRVQGSG